MNLSEKLIDIYRNSHDVKSLSLTMAHDFNSNFVLIRWHIVENTWQCHVLKDNKLQSTYSDGPPNESTYNNQLEIQKLDFKNVLVLINTKRRIPFMYKFVVESFGKSLAVIDKDRRYKYRQQMLVSNICHSIRTPLNGILHMTNLLVCDANSNLSNEHLSYLNQSAVTLANNIFDIVDVTQLSIGNLKINNEVFNVRQLVNEVIAIAKTLLLNPHITLEYYVEPVVPEYAFSDGKRIKQILINLLTNAFHNTKTGEVTLYLGAHLVYDEDCSSNQYNLEFTVSDNGNGMTDEIANGLFKPPEVLLDTKHTGLGLRVSYLLANRLSGNLYLKHTSVAGSKFVFNLITCEEEQPVFDSNTLKSLKGKRVLVLDDSMEKPKICKVLLDYSMDYVAASSYEEILILHINKTFDLVICQTELREENGITIAEQLHSQFNCLFMAIANDDIRLPHGIFHERMSMPRESFAIKTKIMTVFNTIYKTTVVKLLIVEDEPINRIIIEKLLRSVGYTDIDLASNGREAMTMINANQYDVLLIDIRMPIMNGFELAVAVNDKFKNLESKTLEPKTLKPKTLKPKMIGVTAQMLMDGEPSDLFDDFVYKPIDLDELDKKIKACT